VASSPPITPRAWRIGLFVTGALIARAPKLVFIAAAMSAAASVLFLVSSSAPPRMTGPVPSATPGPPVGAVPTRIQRYAVSDYLARIRPSTDRADAFIVDEHVTLTPGSPGDGARPIELELPRRIVQSQSIDLATRQLKIAQPDTLALRTLIPAEEREPGAGVLISFPVIGLPDGAFTQPFLRSEQPVQTRGQLSWTTEVHDVDNGAEYYSGSGLFQPAFSAFRNLGSIGQGLLIVLTNIVLYIWLKIVEPLLSDLTRSALKRCLHLPDPNAAPAPAR
jgi:hypothetical protein